MMDNDTRTPEEKSGLGSNEFIFLIAALTSVVAISIDGMLPALVMIGSDFQIANPNNQQLVIVAFVVSFGLTQIIFGPVSDRFGRLPVLYFGLGLFVCASLAAAFAYDFTLLLTLRALSGIGASAIRITTTAIVRDCYHGRGMARIMSFVFAVFSLAPIVAPAIGQTILTFLDWHWIFIGLGTFGLVLSTWSGLRLKESLPVERRRSLQFGHVMAAFKEILSNKMVMGYTFALTLFFGCLFSFIVSIPQIVTETFGMGEWLAPLFAVVGIGMGLTSFSNGSLVGRYGMRRLSHSALIVFSFFGFVLAVVCYLGSPPAYVVFPLIIICLMNFSFISGNFNSIAMEPLGHLAGAASSVLGLITFTGGAVLGGIVGQMFDGTVLPLAVAFTLFGVLSLTIIFITERGKLFTVESSVE